MNKPKPVLEFYNIQGDASPTSKTSEPPTDLRWLRVQEFFNAKTIAPNTKKAYSFELRRFIDWTDKAWNHINSRDIASYKHYLESRQSDNGRQLSPATVAVAMTTLKSFFKWMELSYYINENPCAAVTIPHQKKPQPQHLSDSEVEALYEALQYRGEMQLRDRAILAVLEHGLRAEEVSQLNISDYDGQRVTIRQAKHDSTGSVPLSPQSSLALDCYIEARRQQENSTRSPLEALFLSHSPKPKLNSQRLGYDGIYKMVRELGRIACGMLVQEWFGLHELPTGVNQSQSQQIQTFLTSSNPSNFPQWALTHLPPQLKTKAQRLSVVHPHQLRHTFATRLVLMGIDSYLARSLTRHESESAYRRYSEYGRAVAAEAAYRLAIAQAESGGKKSVGVPPTAPHLFKTKEHSS